MSRQASTLYPMNNSRFTIYPMPLTTARPFDQMRINLERQLGRFDADNAGKWLSAGENVETIRTRIEAMMKVALVVFVMC
jgi:hypothetical protein